MSKLYNRYEELKNENVNLIYLFECGNFYIALDSDAIVLNETFNLKITKFSNLCDKCGFPKNSLEKYKEQLSNKNIEYKIIEQTNISSGNLIRAIKSILSENELDKMNKEELLEIIEKIKLIIGN